jgi:hypothetical protein
MTKYHASNAVRTLQSVLYISNTERNGRMHKDIAAGVQNTRERDKAKPECPCAGRIEDNIERKNLTKQKNSTIYAREDGKDLENMRARLRHQGSLIWHSSRNQRSPSHHPQSLSVLSRYNGYNI